MRKKANEKKKRKRLSEGEEVVWKGWIVVRGLGGCGGKNK